MIFNERIIKAEFIKRPNRFQAYIKLDGKELMVHVPNTGRCKEILIPGCTVFLREGINPNRKTPYDLIAAFKGDKIINIDSQMPNKVVLEALYDNKIKKLQKYTNIKKEKTYGNSRFDFKLEDNNGNQYYLEVKGVTFEENSITKFPDAPTERGRKHILELIDVKKNGMGAGVIFLIQMNDIKKFMPYDEIDKQFSDALRLANKNGVDIFAYNCKVEEKSIVLDKEVEVIL